ncbi:MAG: hypothetical protein AAGD18_19705 [Actinomycetota bacterium]
MSRARIILVAVGLGAFVGLFSPLLFLIVIIAISVLVAIAVATWGEGREERGVLARPTPYALFAAFAAVFWLIGRLGLILGLAAAIALMVAFFALGGDLG